MLTGTLGLLAGLACTGVKPDTASGDTGPFVPTSIRGVLSITTHYENLDGFREYTFDDAVPTLCSVPGCEWAMDVRGLYTYASTTYNRFNSAEPRTTGYQATLEYVPDYSGYTTITFVYQNTAVGLVDEYIEVVWSSETTGTFQTLPSTVELCQEHTPDSASDVCEWSGTIELL